jgi:hypothetical protein
VSAGANRLRKHAFDRINRICLCLLAALWALPALALGPKKAPVYPEGLFLPVGLTFGASLSPDREGVVLGGEISLAHAFDKKVVGFYADAIYDFSQKQTRVSFGPEFVLWIFGVDLGYLTAFEDDTIRSGLQMRFFASLGIASVYGRWVFIPGASGPDHLGEVGLLLKVPLSLFE